MSLLLSENGSQKRGGWSVEKAKRRYAKKKVKENTAFIVDGDIGIVYYKGSINLTCRTNDLVINSEALFYVTN